MQELMIELAEPLLEFSKVNQVDTPGSKKGSIETGKKGAIMTPSGLEIEQCELHFIRCIKPNDIKKKDTFINGMCL
jgi:hypothetical protein